MGPGFGRHNGRSKLSAMCLPTHSAYVRPSRTSAVAQRNWLLACCGESTSEGTASSLVEAPSKDNKPQNDLMLSSVMINPGTEYRSPFGHTVAKPSQGRGTMTRKRGRLDQQKTLRTSGGPSVTLQ